MKTRTTAIPTGAITNLSRTTRSLTSLSLTNRAFTGTLTALALAAAVIPAHAGNAANAGNSARVTTTSAATTSADNAATRNTIALGNGIAGGLLAGPIGFAAGLFVGDWLSDRVIDGYALPDTQAALADSRTALAESRSRAAELDRRLLAMTSEVGELQQIAVASLQFQVLFHTGNAELDAASAQRVDQLARFLDAQPQLQVRLSGHADPRGGDRYNDSLSAERVASVAALLEARGISAERISTTAFGASQSLSAEGDVDSYAFDRRVDIELLPADAAGLADAR